MKMISTITSYPNDAELKFVDIDTMHVFTITVVNSNNKDVETTTDFKCGHLPKQFVFWTGNDTEARQAIKQFRSHLNRDHKTNLNDFLKEHGVEL